MRVGELFREWPPHTQGLKTPKSCCSTNIPLSGWPQNPVSLTVLEQGSGSKEGGCTLMPNNQHPCIKRFRYPKSTICLVTQRIPLNLLTTIPFLHQFFCVICNTQHFFSFNFIKWTTLCSWNSSKPNLCFPLSCYFIFKVKKTPALKLLIRSIPRHSIPIP